MYPKEKHIDVKHQQWPHLGGEDHSNNPHIGILAAVNGDSSEISEECAIFDFGAPKAYEQQEICRDEFS